MCAYTIPRRQPSINVKILVLTPVCKRTSHSPGKQKLHRYHPTSFLSGSRQPPCTNSPLLLFRIRHSLQQSAMNQIFFPRLQLELWDNPPPPPQEEQIVPRNAVVINAPEPEIGVPREEEEADTLDKVLSTPYPGNSHRERNTNRSPHRAMQMDLRPVLPYALSQAHDLVHLMDGCAALCTSAGGVWVPLFPPSRVLSLAVWSSLPTKLPSFLLSSMIAVRA